MVTKKTKVIKDKDNYKKEIRELKKQVVMLKQLIKDREESKLEDNIQDLNEQIVKMVSVNINLQSKMTELLIKVTDLIRENREIISLLEEASELEPTDKEKNKLNYEGIFNEIKKISSTTSAMSEENKELINYIKKMWTKQLLAKTLNGNISIPQTLNNEEKEVGNI